MPKETTCVHGIVKQQQHSLITQANCSWHGIDIKNKSSYNVNTKWTSKIRINLLHVCTNTEQILE